MAFRLPRLNIAGPVVTQDGFPTPAFHRWWQEVVETIEAQAEQLEIFRRGLGRDRQRREQ